MMIPTVGVQTGVGGTDAAAANKVDEINLFESFAFSSLAALF